METAFQKLLVSTVERYLNANTQIAYLFAFRVESCTLASLPDILITNDERKLRKIGRRIASDRGPGIGTSEMDGAPGLVWINGVMIWIDVLFLDLMKKSYHETTIDVYLDGSFHHRDHSLCFRFKNNARL